MLKGHLSNLVDLFLVLSPDHEHYRTGQIVALVGDCFLIQFDPAKDITDDPPPPMELYTAEELIICRRGTAMGETRKLAHTCR
jgi:hypothetical protein